MFSSHSDATDQEKRNHLNPGFTFHGKGHQLVYVPSTPSLMHTTRAGPLGIRNQASIILLFSFEKGLSAESLHSGLLLCCNFQGFLLGYGLSVSAGTEWVKSNFGVQNLGSPLFLQIQATSSCPVFSREYFDLYGYNFY